MPPLASHPAKADGKKPPKAAEEAPAGKVVDLMAALEASVQKAHASAGSVPMNEVAQMNPGSGSGAGASRIRGGMGPEGPI